LTAEKEAANGGCEEKLLMELIAGIPIWMLFILVFLLRISDVTLGTIRTVTIVKGYIGLSMVLGFCEVSIWIIVISQVISRIGESWLLIFAFAGGFAAGNGIGILIERKLALGLAVVRMVSQGNGTTIADALRAQDLTVTTFAGEGSDGQVTLVYLAGPRRAIQPALRTARSIDPDLFYVIEPAHESNHGVRTRIRPVPHATGWRAVFKKK
jgi:uncharacterized protein YebE (UPF0316 family)